jgi:hypothetical protein
MTLDEISKKKCRDLCVLVTAEKIRDLLDNAFKDYQNDGGDNDPDGFEGMVLELVTEDM